VVAVVIGFAVCLSSEECSEPRESREKEEKLASWESVYVERRVERKESTKEGKGPPLYASK
jgi:hypothetical protein